MQSVFAEIVFKKTRNKHRLLMRPEASDCVISPLLFAGGGGRK
jgi:hypothetical protein